MTYRSPTRQRSIRRSRIPRILRVPKGDLWVAGATRSLPSSYGNASCFEKTHGGLRILKERIRPQLHGMFHRSVHFGNRRLLHRSKRQKGAASPSFGRSYRIHYQLSLSRTTPFIKLRLLSSLFRGLACIRTRSHPFPVDWHGLRK